MAKKVTLLDISSRLGLSTAAVSKALRGLDGISPETRRAVLEMAKKMNYKSAADVPQLPTAQGRRVLFVADSRYMTDPHTMASYFFIDKTLKEIGYQSSLKAVSMTEEFAAQHVLQDEEHAAALLLFGRFSAKMAEQIAALPVPALMLDHEIPYSSIDSVTVDNYEGAFMAVQHLVQHGHTRIGFIGDNRLSYGFLSRYRGFCDALSYWGLDRHSRYMYDIHFADSFGNIDFNRLPDKLDYDDLPTAFFCANDPLAFVLNHALTANGIRTPEHVSIIGFDNLDACQWHSPPITSLDYQREQIAVQAVNLMLWRIENPQAPRNKVMVKPSLVVRSSVTSSRSKLM